MGEISRKYRKLKRIPELKYLDTSLEKARNKLENIIFERQESGVFHNPKEWSEKVLDYIHRYDFEGFLKYMEQKEEQKEEQGWEFGKLAEDDLRSAKNLSIVLITFVFTILLQEDLLQAETAYSISDACIQCIEESKSTRDVYLMRNVAIYEYIEQIKQNTDSNYHYLVRGAQNYIYQNMHKKISISKMAEKLGVSNSYLSQLFQKYEHMTIQEYINSEKMERAVNLLKYSDYNIQEISEYLLFSSQSYFGKLFKQKHNMTPKQYREQYGGYGSKKKK